MRIPKKLKIGGHVYKVIIFENYDRTNKTEFAHIDYLKNEIVIDSELSQDQKESALLHEIIHALNAVLNHVLLDSLSEQLYQVLRDNKLLR